MSKIQKQKSRLLERTVHILVYLIFIAVFRITDIQIKIQLLCICLDHA